jgi:uncharacterized protein
LTVFLDTSALLKRYVEEPGTEDVLVAMEEDQEWVASAIARTEAELALCRLVTDDRQLEGVRGRFRADWARVLVVPVDPECLRAASKIGCSHGLRTLDAIHLAAASRLEQPCTIITFDLAQASAAAGLGMSVRPSSTPAPG